jgi:hypothetical protein
VAASCSSHAAAYATLAKETLLTFHRCRSTLWPTSSQHSSLKTGGAEITSLDKNKEGSHAVLAGRNILKTVRVDGISCIEDINIRGALIDQERPSATKPLDIHDVKWSHGVYSSCIATGMGTGKIVVYDIAAQGIETWRGHEHSRQIHKLAFNPHQGHMLLSASHDGSVLLWDLRDQTPATRFASRERYKVNSGGIRDVKWSPNDGAEFAFSTDQGNVQKWDYRHTNKPKLRINAHERYCTAIDWHPDGKHLMSAGHDKYVKIWDFSSEAKRQRPQWFIRTPYPVANARWRPEYWAAGDRGNGSWQSTQLVTSYDRQFSPAVHLWDFRRPFMPQKEMYWWESAPTDMLWQNQRFLWTVDKEGVFQQGDVKYASKVIDRRPMQAFALSPTGEICVFTQKRPRRRPSDVDAQSGFHSEGEPAESYTERAEVSKSLADESFDDSLLSTSYKRSQSRPISTRSAKSAASTPPSYPESEAHRVAWLSETLSKRRNEPESQTQIAYRGFVEGTLKIPTFTFLAQKYKTAVLPNNPTVGSYISVGRVFEQNASYAQRTGAYRVAQTWRVFGAMITHELKQRAIENRRRRLASPYPSMAQSKGKSKFNGASAFAAINYRNASPLNPALRAIQNADALGIESSSNVQTPVAKPQGSTTQMHNNSAISLPNPDQEVLELPPSRVENKLLALNVFREGKSVTDARNTPVFQESQWYPTANDIQERKEQMQNWRAGPRQPLEFDFQPASPGTMIPPRLGRHNSDDSFGMFSASSGSQLLGTSSMSYTSTRGHRPSMSRILESGDQNSAIVDPEPELFLPPSVPSRSNGVHYDTKGNLSWLTSSSSMDFGGRDFSISSEAFDGQLEASQTIIVENGSKKKQVDHRSRILEQEKSEEYTLSDFSIPIEGLQIKPVSATQMLRELYEYYTDRNPNAQAIYHLATILKPLLTQSKAQQELDGSLLITHEPISGINQLQDEAVLSTYRDQLESLQIYNPSVSLARDAFEDREYLFDDAPGSSQVGLVCLDCNKPINNPVSKFHCENCGKRQANCPVCWQKYPAFEGTKKKQKSAAKAALWSREYKFARPGPSSAAAVTSPEMTADTPALASDPLFTMAAAVEDSDIAPQTNHAILWQSCLVCGHGGHAACLQHVQNDPKIGGKCPTDGCLCDCIPGPYRTRLNRETDEVRRKASVSWVRGDTSSVTESRAVKGARNLLDKENRESVSEKPKQEEKRVRVVEPKPRRG